MENSIENLQTNDLVVYPTHGVGRIKGIESTIIAGMEVKLVVVEFEKDRMTLRIPYAKAQSSGLRRVSSAEDMREALQKLNGKTRSRKTIWSKRAALYESKINSGSPISIAEVVRELYRGPDADDLSYSERQVYQSALKRLASEVAAVESIDEAAAADKLESILSNVA